MGGARVLREGEIESGAVAGFAGRPDPAAVALDDVLDNGESEAGAALLARAGLVHAVEALENAFEGFRRYARAVILNGDLDLPAVQRAPAHGDGAVGAAVFDGVVHEVAEDLLQAVGDRRGRQGPGPG